jgi:hypothetical protein
VLCCCLRLRESVPRSGGSSVPPVVTITSDCIDQNNLITKIEMLVLLTHNAASASGWADLIISLKPSVVSLLGEWFQLTSHMTVDV